MPGKNGKMDKKKGYSKTGKMVAKKKDKKEKPMRRGYA